jgi:type II secretory pathway component PulF
MPTFAYSGRTRGGQNVNGERAADSMDAAVAALRRDQILVTRINPSKEKGEVGDKKKSKLGKLGKKASPKSLAVFVRHDRRGSSAGAVP